MLLKKEDTLMSNRKVQKIVVYSMLVAMLASTILIGISSFL
jgi:hypothetical protein